MVEAILFSNCCGLGKVIALEPAIVRVVGVIGTLRFVEEASGNFI